MADFAHWTYLLCLFLLLGLTQPVQADIGVIVALQSTWENLMQQLPTRHCTTIAKRNFCRTTLSGQPTVLVRSPMGKVNNAITAQALISSFPIDAIISLSPAGAVSPEIEIGDLLVVNEVYQHDFGTTKAYGQIWNRVPDGSDRSESGYNIPHQKLINALTRSIPLMPPNRAHTEILVSGDQFIASAEKRTWLRQKFKACGVDMGGAAIAQTCYANQIPVGILRIITDRADAEAQPTFVESSNGYQTSIDIYGVLETLILETGHLREGDL